MSYFNLVEKSKVYHIYNVTYQHVQQLVQWHKSSKCEAGVGRARDGFWVKRTTFSLKASSSKNKSLGHKRDVNPVLQIDSPVVRPVQPAHGTLTLAFLTLYQHHSGVCRSDVGGATTSSNLEVSGH